MWVIPHVAYWNDNLREQVGLFVVEIPYSTNKKGIHIYNIYIAICYFLNHYNLPACNGHSISVADDKM